MQSNNNTIPSHSLRAVHFSTKFRSKIHYFTVNSLQNSLQIWSARRA
nr:MAG TPA: hypothetical protein [Caudoviricetes sp.]